jgi:hypothetical protein
MHSCSDLVVKGLIKESYSHNWFRHALILPAIDSLDWPARSCPQAGRSECCGITDAARVTADHGDVRNTCTMK